MNLKVEYPGEIKVIFKMALGNESGDQVVRFMKKTRGRKSCKTFPITTTGVSVDPDSKTYQRRVQIFCILALGLK
jgi:hypothetical protein